MEHMGHHGGHERKAHHEPPVHHETAHHEKHGSEKHARWTLDKKKATGALGLGTMGANYGLALAAGIAFPPYLMAGATLLAAYGLYDRGTKGKRRPFTDTTNP